MAPPNLGRRRGRVPRRADPLKANNPAWQPARDERPPGQAASRPVPGQRRRTAYGIRQMHATMSATSRRAHPEPGRSPSPSPVGAENLCHLAGCTADRWLLGPAPARAWDDLRLVGLKLIFLIVTRAVSLLCLSRREWWWKDAEILMLRHQLDVAERERPRAHSRLTWPDRAWLALLAGTVPAERLAAMRLIVTPGAILRWQRDIVRRRRARLSRRGRSHCRSVVNRLCRWFPRLRIPCRDGV